MYCRQVCGKRRLITVGINEATESMPAGGIPHTFMSRCQHPLHGPQKEHVFPCNICHALGMVGAMNYGADRACPSSWCDECEGTRTLATSIGRTSTRHGQSPIKASGTLDLASSSWIPRRGSPRARTSPQMALKAALQDLRRRTQEQEDDQTRSSMATAASVEKGDIASMTAGRDKRKEDSHLLAASMRWKQWRKHAARRSIRMSSSKSCSSGQQQPAAARRSIRMSSSQQQPAAARRSICVSSSKSCSSSQQQQAARRIVCSRTSWTSFRR